VDFEKRIMTNRNMIIKIYALENNSIQKEFEKFEEYNLKLYLC
jgi:hypothetical protein